MAKEKVENKGSEVVLKRKAPKDSAAAGDGPPPAKVQELDLYAKVVSYEEKEAKLRDADQDAATYIQICEEMSGMLLEITKMKLNPTDNTSADIKKLQSQITGKIIHLKKLNRLEKMRMKECRDALQKYREQVDNDHLHLQNLLYENIHLSKEVAKCYDFKSVDEDMDLIPVEDFYATAPKNVTKEEVTKNNPHELKLARLSWELTQRKELAAKIRKLEAAKEAVSKDIEKKKEQLSSLAPHLKTILESTKPLQSLLNLPVDKVKKMHELALLLPDPMYIFFVQAEAFSRLVKWISVSIVGQPDEVQAQEHTFDDISSADSDSDNDVESLYRRKQNPDRRKSAHKTGTSAAEARKSECLKRHPLSIKLTVTLPGGASVTLEFQWLVLLEIVCVVASVSGTESSGIAAVDLLTSDSLLSAIFPGDTGNTCPNPAADFHLRRADLTEFPTDVPALGVPYQWAQTLCGLSFLTGSATTKASVCQENIENILKIIRNRLKNRIALAKEVKLLESGEAFKGKKLHASLNSFSPITLSDFEQLETGLALSSEGIVDGACLFYRAVVEVGGVKLEALIALSPAYPATAPIFVVKILGKKNLSSGRSDHIRDLEREINTCVEDSTSNQLLIDRVQKLLLCCQILAATELTTERTVKATYFRDVMGRKRSHPYRHVTTAGGIFTHR